MRISEDVRRYAAEQGVSEDEAVKRGLEKEGCGVGKKRLGSLREIVNNT